MIDVMKKLVAELAILLHGFSFEKKGRSEARYGVVMTKSERWLEHKDTLFPDISRKRISQLFCSQLF